MLSANNVTVSFGKQVLFKDASITFSPGNCYGMIGANGSGKSTFLKVLSGDIEPNSGSVSHAPNERIAVLRQDQNAFNEHGVLETVILGHARLHKVMQERDAIYAKADFSDADGMRVGELENEFAELNGYEAEAEAATLLDRLGIATELHAKKMRELEGNQKVRVLLAQALFGNPDILLLDEPTNHLDLKSINWLENFLYNFENTVIVVSHDRHFLNKVCTHIADIDFSKISVYPGNYDFWWQASQLALAQKRDANKKKEDKIKELEEFIRRFSANASKSKQATSRKKLVEKLTPEEIPASSRKFPYIAFKPNRESGNVILNVEGISKKVDGEDVLKNYSLSLRKGDKVAFVGSYGLARTTLFQILAGELEPDAGTFTWGQTITPAYFPKDNTKYFKDDEMIIDWLKGYSPNQEEAFVRGFLGRMLFSGDEAFKKVKVLSGGEKVRCMLSRMMLSGANALILDEPTNHLDLEAITSLNNGLMEFPETVLFASHDHQFVDTIANRIVEFTPGGGVIDKYMTFDEYMEDPEISKLRDELCHGHVELEI